MNKMVEDQVKRYIREIPDFPKPGILFKDLTPVLQKPSLCKEITEAISETFKGQKLDAVACLESRGFWFGMLIAQALELPFIPIRKKGKLPYSTVSCNYTLEYGEECIQMHTDAILPENRILIHDDVLATGGTAAAAAELIQKAGGNVAGFSFILELSFLDGKDKLLKYTDKIHSVAVY